MAICPGGSVVSSPKYKDYYAILGVSKTASEKDIKAAYRRLARKYHPDVNPGDKQSEEKFKEISEAYEVIGDPHKRSQYDSYGDEWRRSSQAGWRPGPGTGPSDFDMSGFPDLNELFESLFGGSKRQRPGPSRSQGEDVEYAIELTLDDVCHGTERSLTLRLEDACSRCGGTGMSRQSRSPYDMGATCPDCRGTGRVPRTARVDVKIPAGVSEGQRIRLSGQGAAGPGGIRGDLYLLVRVKEQAGFERQGRDLYTDVSIPYTVAALGGEVSVRTLDGERTITVPAGVQSGQKIRIAGKGIGPSGVHKAGDLYVRVKVSVPKDLAPREKSLLLELAKLRGDRVTA